MQRSNERAKLRRATRDDLPVILELIRELAAYERLSDKVVATEDDLADVLFGERPVAGVVLAEMSESVVGFALFYENVSTFLGRRGLFLEDLFVRPEFRGRGIGRQLLGRFASIARERGCGFLEWRALDWNEPALNFYRALGAQALDDWTVYRVTGDNVERIAELDGS